MPMWRFSLFSSEVEKWLDLGSLFQLGQTQAFQIKKEQQRDRVAAHQATHFAWGRPGLIPTYHQFCLYLKIILSYISISFNYFLKSNTKWVSTWSPRYPALWLMGQAYRDSFFPCSAVRSKVSNGRFGGCGSREELRALSISSIQDTCFWVDFTTLLHIHTWHVFLGGLHQN